jgi:hypothetical protein
MVILSNYLSANSWFCIPIEASDDYVRKFAGYLKNNLRADLKIYVELSNEVWNSLFPSFRFLENYLP